MPRKILLRSNRFPYHVVTRSNHKEWFGLPMRTTWTIARQSLAVANEKHPVVLHGLVLMSNHYHLVLHTPEENIDRFMYEFNKNFSLRLRQRTGLINKMFGGRYKWSLIKGKRHYFHVMKYVYLNPVKAGLVSRAENYSYSTLRFHLGKAGFPIRPEPHFDPSDGHFLEWLRESHSQGQQLAIKTGLQKANFEFAGSRSQRNPPEFDSFG